jgi:hypothetical protein
MIEHEKAETLMKEHVERWKNEATTRYQIIDTLLYDILGWPKSCIICEDHVDEGYTDYTVRDNINRPILLIEAKAETHAFELPHKRNNDDKIRRIRLRTLMSDTNIKAAVRQVVAYCPSVGCELACVTNGHVYIFFRWFIKGSDYTESDAIVIPSIRTFSAHFTSVYNLLCHDAFFNTKQLHKELRGDRSCDFYFPKRTIEHYDDLRPQNHYAKYLNPIARRYFSDIATTDFALMQSCYVFAKGYNDVQTGVQTRITDSITPFFAESGSEEIGERRDGGPLLLRIANAIASKRGDTIILYGGKGAGKSTFLRRLFYYDPPTEIRMHAVPIVIDYIQAPQERDEFVKYTWKQIKQLLDIEKILENNVDTLLPFFEDRYAIALRQELCGLAPKSELFIVKRNELIGKWVADDRYVVERLKHYWAKKAKGIVLAFDNTDQLAPALQDLCFLVAQEVARELNITVIISMREERFCRARTVGVLDAYHNSGFHLAAPDLQNVISKRIRFVIEELRKPNRLIDLPAHTPIQQLESFFSTCLVQFTCSDHHPDGNRRDNALKRFLQECSHDNTRLALVLFSQFTSSGYTNVEEMIANPNWTVSSHQVVKPMMVPTRYNYDEEKSLIPNLFQLRYPVNGSHFTAARILKSLLDGVHLKADGGGFQDICLICDQFEDKYNMREDCEICIDMMLRHGLLEANNRVDSLKVEKAGTTKEYIYADSVRITSFGAYMTDVICRTFTYHELISLDTGIVTQSACNHLVDAARKERAMGMSEEGKKSRLLSRFSRVAQFLVYLDKQEKREQNSFALTDSELIVPTLKKSVYLDLRKVKSSAVRTLGHIEGMEEFFKNYFPEFIDE